MCSHRGSPWFILGTWALLTVSLAQGPQQAAGRGQEEGDSRNTGVFLDATRDAGIDFVHFNGMSGERYLCEMMGPGGAMFDYDNDGDLDLYLVQGRMLGPGKTFADAVFPPSDPESLKDRLYRNDLQTRGTGKRRCTLPTLRTAVESRRRATAWAWRPVISTMMVGPICT